jgi:hypothetical protein
MTTAIRSLAILGTGLVLGACAVTGEMPDEVMKGGQGDASQAATTVNPDKYHAPDGFFGYAWGTRLVDVPDLKLMAGGVALVVGYQGKVIDVQIEHCGPEMPDAPAAGPCRIHQQVQGAGSYVMATYYRNFEPVNPYAGAQLAAAIYYFCARTSGDFVSVQVRKNLRLCGGDVIFQSDAPDSRGEDDPATNYEQVVGALTARHGRPDNFRHSGYVTVEDEFGRESTPRIRRYDPLFWCKVSQRALDPSCKATITLDFDTDTGTGRALFATNAMYRFAEAMHEQSTDKIPLYERLHGRKPDRFKSKRRVCTGTHLCGGSGRPLTDQELAVFQLE